MTTESNPQLVKEKETAMEESRSKTLISLSHPASEVSTQADPPNSGFYEKDGRYSWIILLVIALSSFVMASYSFASAGILTDEYMKLLAIDVSSASIVKSLLIGIMLISSKYRSC